MSGNQRKKFIPVAVLVAMAGLPGTPASAHCDGMDGPVVTAAQKALATGDVDLVLIWVRKEDEAAIRQAFDRTSNVRKLSPEAKELADMYFFEMLVRIHRAGEGAPFTGLKAAGRDLGPAIPAADRALKSGDPAPLTNVLVEGVRAGLLGYYERTRAAQNFDTRNVVAGREYVERYVQFIHYVEGIHEAATVRVEGHYPERAEHSHQGN